jgi:hypothetical protein
MQEHLLMQCSRLRLHLGPPLTTVLMTFPDMSASRTPTKTVHMQMQEHLLMRCSRFKHFKLRTPHTSTHHCANDPART